MKNTYKSIKYLVKTLWYEKKSLFFILIVDIIASSLIQFPTVIFPKYIIDTLMAGEEFNNVIRYSAYMAGSMLALYIIREIVFAKENELAKRLEFQLHTNITNKTLGLDYERLLETSTYDKMFLASDIANGNNFMNLVDNVKNLFSNFIVLLSMLYIILKVDYIIMIATVIVVAVNAITNSAIQKRIMETKFGTSGFIRKLEYIGRLGWHFDFAKDVRIYNCKQFIHDKYNKYNEEVLKRIFKDYKLEKKGKIINFTFEEVQSFLIYIILGYKVIISAITIGEFTAYMNAINNFKNAINGLLNNCIFIKSQTSFFTCYQDYMDIDQTLDLGGNKKIDKFNEYEFQHVFYKYPGQSDYALKDISVKFSKGDKLSLVGENGAGKTTFILLALGLLKPTEGKILCNGEDISKYDKDSFTKLFGVVFQDFKIFAFSIKENLCFNENLMDEFKIKDVIERCGLNDKVLSLKEGWDSPIGKEFYDNGIDLSGGEKQKLAIGRALYKDAPIIIMDEPTAALDANAEYEIYCRMNQLAKEKTAIYISHRLYSTKFCNRILVFKDSQIIESGSHEQLMENKGTYYDMYSLQAHYYE